MTRPPIRSIPITRRRELTIHGDDWVEVLGVDRGLVSTLLAQVDPEVIAGLDRCIDAAESVMVMVSDDRVSLWIGETRLAVLPSERRARVKKKEVRR